MNWLRVLLHTVDIDTKCVDRQKNEYLQLAVIAPDLTFQFFDDRRL
jgi:hypothetical protein